MHCVSEIWIFWLTEPGNVFIDSTNIFNAWTTFWRAMANNGINNGTDEKIKNMMPVNTTKNAMGIATIFDNKK